MKQKIKLLVALSFCFCIVSVCLFAVFAVTKFSFESTGSVEFIAEEGVDVTVSAASLSGLSKQSGSGQMQAFTVTKSMTQSQIEALSGYKSWSGLKLQFDSASNGIATLTFTVTNNSKRVIDNVMVEITTNTNIKSEITATPSADFCINPNSSHTFDVEFVVQNPNQGSKLNNFALTVDLKLLKSDEVLEEGSEDIYEELSFTYDEDEGTAEIINCSDTLNSEVVIPSVVKYDERVYTIASIKDGTPTEYAFKEIAVAETMESLVLPNTITKIGAYALMDCDELTTLSLPHSLEEMGQCAFGGLDGCKGELILTPRINIIAEDAFVDSFFSGTLIIPRGVTEIKDYAFASSFYFTGLVLREGLVSVGAEAFGDCNALTGQLLLPKGLKYINDSAFSSCNFTGNLIVPEGVTHIYNAAFSRAGFSGKLVLPSTITIIDDDAFNNTGFEVVVCNAETPPTLGQNGIRPAGEVYLYVPDSADAAYNAVAAWKGHQIFPLSALE